MSNTIDSRVVEMQFDNAAFERGVKQSQQSLKNLDKTINDTTNKSFNGSIFSKFGNAISRLLPTNQIVSAASTVSSAIGSIFSGTFSAIETATKIGIGSLTALGASITALAVSGGMSRALNIEQAKFQLNGLGVAWENIYDDIDYAVAGTAYGLDSAAKAASQLVASGIEVGDGMKTALRGISGVAAMTNREYDEVAHIFTTVAGNGRLMGQQLTQLSSYGLNVAATLAKSEAVIRKFGELTEAEIRDLVSEGKIDFETFAEAMDEAFGEHAKDANNTFTGALSNMKFAIKKIGADFATPFIENMRPIFNSVRLFINMVRNSLKPVVTEFASIMERLKNGITNFIDPITDATERFDEFGNRISAPSEIFVSRLSAIFSNLISISNDLSESIGNAFASVFSLDRIDTSASSILHFIYSMQSLTGSIKDFVHNANFEPVLAAIMRPLHTMLSGFASAGAAISGFLGAVNHVESSVEAIKTAYDPLGNIVTTLGTIEKPVSNAANIFNNLGEIIRNVAMVFNLFISGWNRIIVAGIEVALPVINAAIELFTRFSQSIKNAFFDLESGEAEGFNAFIDKIVEDIKAFAPSAETLNKVVDVLSDKFEALVNFIAKVNGAFSDMLPPASSLASGIDLLASVFDTLLDTLSKLQPDFSAIESFFSNMKEDTAEIAEHSDFSFLDNLMEFVKNVKAGDVFQAISSAINTAILGFGVFGLQRIARNIAQAIQQFTNGSLSRVLGLDFSVFNKTIDTLGRTMLTLQGAIKADMIQKIAFALLAFAGALLVLSTINPERMISVTIALAEFVAIMASTMKLMNVMMSSANPTAMLGIIGMMIAISATIGNMAIAMKILSSISLENLLPAVIGLIAIVEMLQVLLIAIKSLATAGGGKTILAASVMFSQLGGMFLLMAVSMKVLSTIPIESLLPAVLSMVVMVDAMAVLVASLGIFGKHAGAIAASALMFSQLGGVFFLLAISLRVLSNADPLGLLAAVVSMTAVIIALGVLISAIGRIPTASILTGAFAIGNMGLLLTQMAAALKKIANVQASSLLKAVLAIGAVVAELGVIVVALSALNPAKAQSGLNGLTTMALALLMLAPAISMIASIPFSGVISLLISLAGTMAILGAAIVLIPKGSMFAFAAGLASIAASLMAFGISAILASTSFMMIVTGITMLLATIGSLPEDIRQGMAAAGEGFATFIVSAVNALQEHYEELVDAGINLILEFLTGIKNSTEEIVTVAVETIGAFLSGIANNIGYVVATGVDIIVNFIAGVASQIGAVVESAIWTGIMFIKGLADGFRDNIEFVITAVNVLINTIGATLLGGLADILASNPLTSGLAEDVRGSSDDLAAAAEEASAALQERFDEKYGNVEQGASEMRDDVVNTMSDSSAYTPIGEGLATGVSDGIMSGGSLIPEQFQGIMDELGVQMDTSTLMSGEKGTQAGQEYASGLGDAEPDIIAKFTNASEKASDEAGSVDSRSDGNTVGDNFGSGVYYGIDAWRSSVASKARQMVSEAKSAANAEMDAASPAKDLIKSGGWFGEGCMIGIANMIKPVSDTASDMVSGAKESVVGMIAATGDLLDSIDWDANPVITPVLDTSMLKSGARSINGMFGGSSVGMGFGLNSSAMPRVPIQSMNSNRGIQNNNTNIYIDGDLLRSDDDLRNMYEAWTMEVRRRVMA